MANEALGGGRIKGEGCLLRGHVTLIRPEHRPRTKDSFNSPEMLQTKPLKTVAKTNFFFLLKTKMKEKKERRVQCSGCYWVKLHTAPAKPFFIYLPSFSPRAGGQRKGLQESHILFSLFQKHSNKDRVPWHAAKGMCV